MRECVTHHRACDCRENKFETLGEENERLKESVERQGDALDWSALEIGRLGGKQVPGDNKRAVLARLEAGLAKARISAFNEAMTAISNRLCGEPDCNDPLCPAAQAAEELRALLDK